MVRSAKNSVASFNRILPRRRDSTERGIPLFQNTEIMKFYLFYSNDVLLVTQLKEVEITDERTDARCGRIRRITSRDLVPGKEIAG